MTARAAIATTTAAITSTVTSTTAITTIASVVATGFATGAEVTELTGDLAVESVFEAHRHGSTRTRTIARRTRRARRRVATGGRREVVAHRSE